MIKQVFIKNFKAFQEINLELKNLTLFTGVNSMGKSSFIQALLLLRQSQMEKELPEKLMLNSDKYLQLRKSQDVFNFFAKDNEKLVISLLLENGRKIEVEADFGYEKTWFEVSRYLPQNWKDSYAEPLFNHNFQYLKADRLSPQDSYSLNQYEVEVLRNLGSTGEYAAHFLAKYSNETVKLPSLIDEDLPNFLIQQIQPWLNKVSKGVKVFADIFEEGNFAKLSYQFPNGEDFTPKFSPINVGFGISYVLPILVAVLSAKPGDLLILENPESHLHPSGQARIGQFLALAAQDGVQIIVETHSDHILNGIRVATKHFHQAPQNERVGKGIDCENTAIYFFTRKKHQHITDIIPVKINEEGRLSKWPKDFFDEWDNMLNELLD